MSYGLVCISEVLKEDDKTLAFKTITRKRFAQLENDQSGSGLLVLEERILHNLNLTRRIIEHCASQGIFHYRLSSAMFPLMTDPTLGLELEKLSNYQDICESCDAIGVAAQSLSVSLSLHPDQFNVLASEKPAVVQKTIDELNFHAAIMDLIGLPQDYSAPINIHPSLSPKQNKEELFREIVDRFYVAFSKCSQGVRKRLVVENEDKGLWTCANLFMYFHNYCGTKHNHFFPLTYDNLHDYCNPSVFENNKITIQQNIDAFEKTWPSNYTPVFHWSWGKNGSRSHADYADEQAPQYNRKIKWELEVKAKDKAIFRLLNPTKETEDLKEGAQQASEETVIKQEEVKAVEKNVPAKPPEEKIETHNCNAGFNYIYGR